MSLVAADYELREEIILLVGPDRVQISVCPDILCATSRPFKKMLGPNFLEGQEQDGPEKKQVMLPDDKPVAMEMMCNIIQHRNSNLPPDPTAMEIYDLAIAADKYDCVVATSLAARAWMQLDSVSNAHDLGLFMLAAYIYAVPETFFQVTARLVLSYEGSYQTLDNIPGFVEHFGWEVMLCLEEKRSLVRFELNKILAQATSLVACSHGCDWSAQQVTKCITLLEKSSLFPIDPSKKLSYGIDIAKHLAIPEATIRSNCPGARWHRDLDLSTRKRELSKLSEISGLCYKCLRSRIGGRGDHCQIHS